MANKSRDTTCFFLQMDTKAVQEAYASFTLSIIFNIAIAIPTVLFNTLFIVTFWRTKSLHTPSNVLLCSLAFTDLGVGMVTQPFYVPYTLAEIHGNFASYCFTGITALVSGYTFVGGSLFTLTAISLDRYLALHLGLRYRSTVTTSRVTRVLLVLWMLAVLLGTSQLFLDQKIFFRVTAALMVVCLIICISAYSMAFRALKHHQERLAANNFAPSSFRPRDLKKYRKSLKTMVYILVLMMLCYVPSLCVAVAIAIKGLNAHTRAARSISSPIVFCNSAINPIFYSVRITDIRHACCHVLREALHLNTVTVLPESVDVTTDGAVVIEQVSYECEK